jgi:hypothetical protein
MYEYYPTFWAWNPGKRARVYPKVIYFRFNKLYKFKGIRHVRFCIKNSIYSKFHISQRPREVLPNCITRKKSLSIIRERKMPASRAGGQEALQVQR